MAYYKQEPKYEHGDQLKVGILLANLGTPDAPTAAGFTPVFTPIFKRHARGRNSTCLFGGSF